jgi:hypothetical protein
VELDEAIKAQTNGMNDLQCPATSTDSLLIARALPSGAGHVVFLFSTRGQSRALCAVSRAVQRAALLAHNWNRNLPYKIASEEMYELFGKYGAVRQIRLYQGAAAAAAEESLY